MERATIDDHAQQATSRRALLASFGAVGGALAGGALLAACGRPATTESTSETAGESRPAHPHLVRVLAASSLYGTGLLQSIAGGFEHHTGYRVQVATAADVLGKSLSGGGDLVVCDYVYGTLPSGHPRGHGAGHRQRGGGSGAGGGGGGSGTGDGRGGGGGGGGGGSRPGTRQGPRSSGMSTESFVLGGHGLWPAPFLSLGAMLLGPPSDPAGVLGYASAVAAIQRIAATNSLYLVPADPLTAYFDQLVFTLGDVTEGAWWTPTTEAGEDALALAARHRAYTIWAGGPIPAPLAQSLVPMVSTDPLLRRDFVSIVVNPAKVGGVNAVGAEALQGYLVEPATQATVYSYRGQAKGEPEPAMLPDGADDVAI